MRVAHFQTLPDLWLLSDERNDAQLERALRHLPRGSGFIYRHYHLDDRLRKERFVDLARLARACGHCVILSGDPQMAQCWGADGTYGPARAPVAGLVHIATAHDMAEIAAANRSRAAALLLSPVFETRSHPGGTVLGPLRFRLLAAKARMPVIALGGMSRTSARRLAWPRWAAIDGLSRASRPAFALPQES